MQKYVFSDQPKIPAQFSFTVVGRIEQSSKALHIITDNGEFLRVLPTFKKYNDEQRVWHLLPSINSTGIISSVQVLGSSIAGANNSGSGKCVLVARVLQVSKRAGVVLFQVDLPEEKPLSDYPRISRSFDARLASLVSHCSSTRK